jgi:hypothetical protein
MTAHISAHISEQPPASRGDFKADEDREPLTELGHDEIQLEARAVAIGFALVWVAMFEAEIGLLSDEHPPVAERLFGCLNRLGLRDDSFAMEVLSDLLKAWLNPEGTGGTPPSSPHVTLSTQHWSTCSDIWRNFQYIGLGNSKYNQRNKIPISHVRSATLPRSLNEIHPLLVWDVHVDAVNGQFVRRTRSAPAPIVHRLRPGQGNQPGYEGPGLAGAHRASARTFRR